MKSSKILLAGIVLVVAFGLAGYGTVQKKEEMKVTETRLKEVNRELRLPQWRSKREM